MLALALATRRRRTPKSLLTRGGFYEKTRSVVAPAGRVVVVLTGAAWQPPIAARDITVLALDPQVGSLPAAAPSGDD